MAETIAWLDADGNETVLTGDPNIEVLWGVEGRFMPPFAFIEDRVPRQPGSRLREVNALVREVDLPVIIHGETETGLRDRLNDFLLAFHPGRGDGRLKVTRPDAAVRELYCRYAGGLELSESEEAAGFGWQMMLLVFRAHDPYWYDSSTQVATYELDTSAATFFPFFPLRLVSSEVFADDTIDNTGDEEAWPTWEITGPGSAIKLRNLTTGKVIDLSGVSLSAGETVSIDTTPGVKTVLHSDGSNLFGSLSSDSSLWPLVRGSNAIRVEMSGATTDSEVVLSYRRRYLGP